MMAELHFVLLTIAICVAVGFAIGRHMQDDDDLNQYF